MTPELRGPAIIREPRLNRLAAFTEAEREKLGLVGLVPECVDNHEIQLRRAARRLAEKPLGFVNYLELRNLQDTDEALFYRLLRSDPSRFLPLVYTPTVAEACLRFGDLATRPRGLFLSIRRRGHVREILRNWPERDVRFIVVTSGERILGLGDLGAHGMPIPIGKLVLYSAVGGVPPWFTLPITIDCGTNNESLLNDSLYVGVRQRRASTQELDQFVEEFVTAAQKEFPNCCIQFEDWGRADALRLLSRYRDRVCCFNDDIQGSGAAVLAGMLSAMRITGAQLRDQTFLILGAGSAAIGIAQMLVEAMGLQGLTREQARERVWLFNRNGLIESTRPDLTDYQKAYAHAHERSSDFVAAAESIRPTAIIGVSAAAGAFNQRVIEAMARINRRPIVFALSNPTSRSECSAEEVYGWSEGRAVFASGSPFPAVHYQEQVLVPGQCNNAYVFPAIGLAVYATVAARVTDEIFMTAAHAIAERVAEADLGHGLVYPPQSTLLDTEFHAACRVAEVIFARGLARVPPPDDLRAFIEARVYKPRYEALV